jgi:predicted dehydrogenase
MRVGIIGAGLIGKKRAAALGDAKLVAVADIDLSRAQALAAPYGADATDDPHALAKRDDIDIVMIATTHMALAELTLAAVEAGKHVLVEKPGARNVDEITPVVQAADERGVLVRVGFNHRYHPGFIKAREIIASGVVGELMFIRGRYGHGGRIGYEQEWRADPVLSGGGELLDQGMHLIDLSRSILGDFPTVSGFATTMYWDMQVDDNAFMTLRTAKNQVAHLHVTWTEWKNMFSFEIYGRDAKLVIDGLGGSYGAESLTHYQMLPEMGPPETVVYQFRPGDTSWKVEFDEFLEDIRLNRRPAASIHDAQAALQIVRELYQQSGYDL